VYIAAKNILGMSHSEQKSGNSATSKSASEGNAGNQRRFFPFACASGS
jgi:hypothetical protein